MPLNLAKVLLAGANFCLEGGNVGVLLLNEFLWGVNLPEGRRDFGLLLLGGLDQQRSQAVVGDRAGIFAVGLVGNGFRDTTPTSPPT